MSNPEVCGWSRRSWDYMLPLLGLGYPWLVVELLKVLKRTDEGRIGNVCIFKLYIEDHGTIYCIYSIQVLFQVFPEISSSPWEWNTAAGHLGMFVSWNSWPCFPRMELPCDPMKLYEIIRYTLNTHLKLNISPLPNRSRQWTMIYPKSKSLSCFILRWLGTIPGPCFPTCRRYADNSLYSSFLSVQSCNLTIFDFCCILVNIMLCSRSGFVIYSIRSTIKCGVLNFCGDCPASPSVYHVHTFISLDQRLTTNWAVSKKWLALGAEATPDSRESRAMVWW